MSDLRNVVYQDTGGWCYDCQKQSVGLAGPGHSPLNGNANYVCSDHMDNDAVLLDEDFNVVARP